MPHTPTTPENPELKPGRLPILIAATILVSMTATMVVIVSSDIGSGLGFSSANLAWILTAYTLAYGGLLIVGGRLSDAWGPRRALVIGLGIFALASLTATFALSPLVFSLARGVQGVGAALVGPAVLAFITRGYHGHKRSRAVAIFSASMGFSTSAGMVVGAFLAQWLDWTWIFGISAVAATVLLLLTLMFLPVALGHGVKIDFIGAFLATGTSVGIVLTLTATAGGSGPLIGILGGAATLIVFLLLIWRLRAAQEPLIPLEILSKAGRNIALVANASVALGTTGLVFFLSRFLREDLGYTPILVGVVFLTFSIPQLASSLAANRALARWGTRHVALGGLALAAIGFISLIWVPSFERMNGIIFAALLVIGLGLGAAMLAINVITLAGTAAQHAGAVSGLLQTSLQLGAAIGIAVLVLVNELWGYGAVYAVSALLLILAFAGISRHADDHKTELNR